LRTVTAADVNGPGSAIPPQPATTWSTHLDARIKST
jgi:hypothetical protein